MTGAGAAAGAGRAGRAKAFAAGCAWGIAAAPVKAVSPPIGEGATTGGGGGGSGSDATCAILWALPEGPAKRDLRAKVGAASALKPPLPPVAPPPSL